MNLANKALERKRAEERTKAYTLRANALKYYSERRKKVLIEQLVGLKRCLVGTYGKDRAKKILEEELVRVEILNEMANTLFPVLDVRAGEDEDAVIDFFYHLGFNQKYTNKVLGGEKKRVPLLEEGFYLFPKLAFILGRHHEKCEYRKTQGKSPCVFFEVLKEGHPKMYLMLD